MSGRPTLRDVDPVSAEQLRLLARGVADAVPSIVNALLAARAPRVHREVMVLLEGPLLAYALTLTGGNQLHAARLLGLNRNTLRKRCRQLGVVAPPRRSGRLAAIPLSPS